MLFEKNKLSDFKIKGLLQTKDGFVLKAVQSPPRGMRELDFFKRIFNSKDFDLNKDEIDLRKIIPEFNDIVIHNDGTCFYN